MNHSPLTLFRYKVSTLGTLLTVILAPSPLETLDVVIPSTSPATYPDPVFAIETENILLLAIVTIPTAPDPLPLIV